MNSDPVAPPDDKIPARGELGISEKRSWKTWHLVTAIVVATLVGMAIDHYTDRGSSSGTKPNSAAYHPPPPAGSTGSTTSVVAGDKASSSTTVGGGGSSTTAAGGSAATSSTTSSSSAPAGPAQILLGPTQSQGNWTSPPFTVTAAGWNIGWAFRCTPAPTGGPSFQVSVVPAGTSPTGAAVISETGATGQSVSAESTVGKQVLVVQAPSTCVWAVKVTGS